MVDELGVCRGQVRIDVAVVNGRFHGYEIKSDRDSLRRLDGQVDLYSKVLDRATIVVGDRHFTEALNTVLNAEIEKTMVDLTPMARLGEVEDVALGALYLCSPAASYVTGDILNVNGGLERLNMQMPRAWGGVG